MHFWTVWFWLIWGYAKLLMKYSEFKLIHFQIFLKQSFKFWYRLQININRTFWNITSLLIYSIELTSYLVTKEFNSKILHFVDIELELNYFDWIAWFSMFNWFSFKEVNLYSLILSVSSWYLFYFVDEFLLISISKDKSFSDKAI